MPKFLCDCPSDLLKMPAAAIAIFVASIGALVFAFILQYGFVVQPCVLCLWQRVPFGLCAALAVTALVWRPYRAWARVLLGICAALFFLNACLAFFHTGVELHWWEGTSGCAITPIHAASVEDLRTKILNTVMGHCDVVNWRFLGLSMANWNIPFSFGLGVFSSIAAFFRPSKRRK